MHRHLVTAIGFYRHYERHLSATFMVGGFAFDNWAFGPLDHRATHMVFISYLLMTGGAIALLHYFEGQPEEKRPSARIRHFIALAAQFALGALLSGFCVFYLRSAAVIASWPYLLVLAGIFIGNEVFREYLSELAISSLLFFFALFSYAILLVPVLLASIGTVPFLLAGVLAIVVFALFLSLLSSINEPRLAAARLYIIAGALGIFAAINGFYFAGILPPLPLALVDAGVYHTAQKAGNVYEVTTEPSTWQQWFTRSPIVHLAPGEKLYLYSAVFVPVRMATPIVHRWQWYNPVSKRWEGQGNVGFTVRGGRDEGYRGYTIKSRPKAGEWRVDVATGDGRPMGRVRFTVAFVDAPVPLQKETLN